MSSATKELLLAVHVDDVERDVERFERSMGILWDTQELLAHEVAKEEAKHKKGKKEAVVIPAKVRIPALVALAPEMFKAIAEGYRKKWKVALDVMQNVPKGNTIVDVGTLSPAEARDFWKAMAGQMPPNPEPKEP